MSKKAKKFKPKPYIKTQFDSPTKAELQVLLWEQRTIGPEGRIRYHFGDIVDTGKFPSNKTTLGEQKTKLKEFTKLYNERVQQWNKSKP